VTSFLDTTARLAPHLALSTGAWALPGLGVVLAGAACVAFGGRLNHHWWQRVLRWGGLALLGFGAIMLPALGDWPAGGRSFSMHMAGQIVLLFGGCALIYGACRFADIVGGARLTHVPLQEVRRRRRLLIGLHVLYFGTYIFFVGLAFAVPEAQALFTRALGQMLRSGQAGHVAAAARAYAARDITVAAARTVTVNFFIGSVAVITLPSLILPGCGSALLVVRFAVLGLLLAPTSVGLGRAMLPHSLAMLVELEAYVLASFFALLVPVYVFSSGQDGGPLRRYGRAVMLNLRGNLVVFALLLAAGVYEAFEVILQI